MAEQVALTQLATRVPVDLHKRLKIAAVKSEKSLMEIVAEALGAWLEKHGKSKS